jgi:hypothetical protein
MIKSKITALLLSVLSMAAMAQKLPAVQEASVWAPANVKVDAKLNEWNDTFQAMNKTTDVYYTMANDADNLYFVMKSANQSNNNKIIGGGINLTFNTSGKKTNKEAFVLIFPVVNITNLRTNMMQSMRAMNGQAPDSAAIEGMRRKAISTFKEIKLIGFKDIPDSVISIYNEYGIKGYVDFDSKGSLVIEMAVPLKAMGIKPGTEFSYNVKLNGIDISALMAGFGMGGGGGMVMGAPSVGMGGGGNASFSGGGGGITVTSMPRGMGDMANMFSPTDFWGKYTLSKK